MAHKFSLKVTILGLGKKVGHRRLGEISDLIRNNDKSISYDAF